MPDKSIIPNKYHAFISPSLRRIFLDAQEDNSRAVIENLNTKIAGLKMRILSLNRERDLLINRCDEALTRLKVEEHAVYLAKSKAKADALEMNRLRAGSQITCEVPTSSFNTGVTLLFFFLFAIMKLFSWSAGRK
jgi:hypothetical protein